MAQVQATVPPDQISLSQARARRPQVEVVALLTQTQAQLMAALAPCKVAQAQLMVVHL